MLFVCSLLASVAWARQGDRVTGRVTDENARPLEGVTVTVKGKPNMGAASSSDGGFSLELVAGDTVLFRMVGYRPHDEIYQGQSAIAVQLAEDLTDLDEVVVVGFGTQKKVNLTGSVSTVSAAEIANNTAVNTSTALQGLAPGVTVTQSNGAPGSTGTIRVRGVGTLGNSNPLVLIDGVEGNMNNIDPNLIESLTVLKDAASSAIYGSRAANGVVLITTKRAKGSGLTVNYNGFSGWQRPTNLPNKVNALDHMLLINEAYTNTGRSPLHTEEWINLYRTEGPQNRDLYPDTDWQREVLNGSGFMHNHFLSINGGSEKVRFLTSAGLIEQQGLLRTSKFQRATLRNNADITFSDKLKMTLDLQINNNHTLAPGRGMGSVFSQMNRIPADLPARFSDGNWGLAWNGNNPVAISSPDGGRDNQHQPEVLLNTTLTYRPADWVEAKVIVAPRYVETMSHVFNRAITTYNADGSVAFVAPALTTLTESNTRGFYNNFNGTVTFNKEVANHNLKLLVGASREDYSMRNFSASRQGYVLPDYPVLGAGSAENQLNAGGGTEWALQSFFGRFNYNYDEKYLLEVNGRYDGSSRFAQGHKYGFFPSLSAGWRVSEENFMQPIKAVVNELKVRGSWGMLGNQNIGNYPFASYLDLGSYTFNNEVVDMAALTTMANPLISWETAEMLDLGLDVTLWNNLTITADYYVKRTRDILLELDIPITVGLNAPYQNAGIVDNRGWDLAVRYTNYNSAFKYDVTLNLSDVRNEVVDIKGIQQTGVTINREGYAMNSIFGYLADGLFQSDAEVEAHATQFGNTSAGDVRYRDMNGDGIINADDMVIIGSTIPRYTFGANFNATYRKFDLNVFFQGVGKADGLLYGEAIMPFYSGGTAQEQHKDRWSPDNPNATFPRLAFSEVNNEMVSSYWLRNAAYARLKNIQLGYRFDSESIRKLGVGAVYVYVNGRDLFTIDNFWRGHDVETPVGTGRVYPQLKTYSFGLNLTF